MFAETIVSIFLLFNAPVVHAGEQTRFYSSDGKSQGTATPEGQGTTRYRDATGKTIGTSTTGPDGTTRYYSPDGKSLGSSSGPPVRPERR
jgi:hypothetical protein